METRLMRSSSDKFIGGVAGGLAVYLGVDPVLVRLGFIILACSGGLGLPLYFVLMVLMPMDDDPGRDQNATIEKNIDELGNTIRSAVDSSRQHPQGPTLTALILIVLGTYFLLNNFGWFDASLLWPIILIGGGAYLIMRRKK